jgi:hypothetical protein
MGIPAANSGVTDWLIYLGIALLVTMVALLVTMIILLIMIRPP